MISKQTGMDTHDWPLLPCSLPYGGSTLDHTHRIAPCFETRDIRTCDKVRPVREPAGLLRFCNVGKITQTVMAQAESCTLERKYHAPPVFRKTGPIFPMQACIPFHACLKITRSHFHSVHSPLLPSFSLSKRASPSIRVLLQSFIPAFSLASLVTFLCRFPWEYACEFLIVVRMKEETYLLLAVWSCGDLIFSR